MPSALRLLKENKEDIAKERRASKPRGASLRAQFNAARRDSDQRAEHSAGGERSKGGDKPVQARDHAAARGAAFKKQARDVRRRKEGRKPPREGSLAEKFKAARDRNPAQERSEQKRGEFRENANDVSRDTGRERSRSLKPPQRKPD